MGETLKRCPKIENHVLNYDDILVKEGFIKAIKKVKIFKIKGCVSAFTRLEGCRGCFMEGVWLDQSAETINL